MEDATHLNLQREVKAVESQGETQSARLIIKIMLFGALPHNPIIGTIYEANDCFAPKSILTVSLLTLFCDSQNRFDRIFVMDIDEIEIGTSSSRF